MPSWPQLLPELQAFTVSFLDANEVAGSVRIVNKAAAALLSGPKHTTVRVSQPVPPHAFAQHWERLGAMSSLTYKQRLRLLCLTAASGSIPNLEFLLPRVGCLLTTDVLAAAAAAGQLAMCKQLRQQGCPWDYEVAFAAGKANRREVLEWLVAAGCPGAARSAAEGAARGGHAGLLVWLVPQVHLHPLDLLLLAAEGCDLPALQRLLATLLGGRNIDGGAKQRIIAAAAGSPTPDWRGKVEWLEAAGFPRSSMANLFAARCPDALPRLAWLRARGFPVHPLHAESVAWRVTGLKGPSDLEALERILGGGTAADGGWRLRLQERVSGAFEQGLVDALQALHDQGRLSPCCVHSAARHGLIPVVAWAVETLGAGVLTARVFSEAARSGSVPLLAWLLEQGCPWSRSTFEWAAEGGCEEALEWLAAHGCPMEVSHGAYERAVGNGDLATLACLRRLGCPWDAYVFTGALTAGRSFPAPMAALRWLLDHGCPVDWAAALERAREDRIFVEPDDPEVTGLTTWLEEGQQRQAAAAQAQAGVPDA